MTMATAKRDEEFYSWVMLECIKDTYENWGVDMMSMLPEIQEDLPTAAEAIQKMYDVVPVMKDGNSINHYQHVAKTFSDPDKVYQVIENLIPNKEKFLVDISTRVRGWYYKIFNISPCSVKMRREDLIIAILLFTESFIFSPLTIGNVVYEEEKNKIKVYTPYIKFKISKTETKTYITIRIFRVALLQYVIRNK